MIKLISGVYGYKCGNGSIVAKSPSDPPFSLSQKQENRLVTRGAAEYVNEEVSPTIEEPLTATEKPYSVDMPRAELDKIAEAHGFNTRRLNSKAEVVAAIEQFVVNFETEQEQPNLNITETVVVG